MKLPVVYNSLDLYKKRLVRSEYMSIQKGLCYYCKKPLGEEPNKDKKINWSLFPRNFLKYPNHLHHSHETGLTIGVVHAYCNAVLWQYHGE